MAPAPARGCGDGESVAARTDQAADPGRETGSRAPRAASYGAPVSQTPPELTSLRQSIDNVDAALVHLLAERFKATQRVGVLKAELGLPPADPRREERQIERLRALADEAGLDPHFAEKFLNFIIAEVIRHHEAIAEATTDTSARAADDPRAEG